MTAIDTISLLEHTRTACFKSALAKEYVLAKAVTQLTNWQGRQIVLGGFAAGRDASDAAMRARAELCERVFALYDFQRDRVQSSNVFEVARWPDLQSRQAIDASQVLLGPFPPGGQGSDSTGLSWANDFEFACSHATLEILERHLLGEIWYQRLPIARLETKAIGRHLVDLYTITDPTRLPFALAVLHNLRVTWLVCGSSLRLHLSDAVEHAIDEAIMLFDTISMPIRNSGLNAQTYKRVLSLANPTISLLRWHHISSAALSVVPHVDLPVEFDLHGLVTTVLRKRESDVLVASLHSADNEHLVRAIIPNALQLSVLRASHPQAIPDPFC